MATVDECSPAVRARVDAVNARIVAAGIKDLKFHKDPDKWASMTVDQRANELCDVMEAYFNGDCLPIVRYMHPDRTLFYTGRADLLPGARAMADEHATFYPYGRDCAA